MRRLAKRAAEVFDGEISFARGERGRVSIALSRPTPREVFARVAKVRLPRRDVDIFQVDERAAKATSDERNLYLIKRDLGQWLKTAQMHSMPVEPISSRAARKYEEELVEVCGRSPGIDLVHLGLGADGHTASLLPGDPVLDVTDRLVAITKKQGARMTLTYPALNNARLVVFIVVGEEKADALRGVLRADKKLPAARLEAPNVLFLADREAASRL